MQPLHFSLPSSRVQAPVGGLAADLVSAPDQQAAYDSFLAAADPSRAEFASFTAAYGDVRILAISSAVYQPYEITTTFYQNGAEVGQFVGTQSLSGVWSGYLQSAISQVPADAWTVRMIGKPPNQIEDYTYYKNTLIGAVTTSMTNFANQNAALANSNLLDAMSHLDGNANRTQYIADPAARSNLYGIFQKVQLHVLHVATGVPETL